MHILMPYNYLLMNNGDSIIRADKCLFDRDCGILLHPTCLPGPFGIGDIGPSAINWIHLLADAQQNIWQILPMNPSGYGDSPYQGLSASAANPILISPEQLYTEGLLSADELELLKVPASAQINYSLVYKNKKRMTSMAASRFFNTDQSDPLYKRYLKFVQHSSGWLSEYALFYALKEKHAGVSWTDWPAKFRDRDSNALQHVSVELKEIINRVTFEQFILTEQWSLLRAKASECGVRIVGDLPIFVAHDSVDVWSRPELFNLCANGKPSVVAGVPPDYFSATGQLWGNPLYNWEAHRTDKFDWWCTRLKNILSWVDIVRVDHFRGFDSYWEIPADSKTAQNGRWIPSCGDEILREFSKICGHPMPLIAEDLGVITDAVVELRERYELPGIRILQFAFGNDPMRSSFIPESYDKSCVAYSGTHDNDTTMGWFHSVSGESSTRSDIEINAERASAQAYFGSDGSEIHLDFIRSIYASDAAAAIIPLQDLLGFGSDARMNTPGNSSGSWVWRLHNTDGLAEAMKTLAAITIKTSRGLSRKKTT
jgi:4-alpha-glucanotransferase